MSTAAIQALGYTQFAPSDAVNMFTVARTANAAIRAKTLAYIERLLAREMDYPREGAEPRYGSADAPLSCSPLYSATVLLSRTRTAAVFFLSVVRTSVKVAAPRRTRGGAIPA